MVFQEDRLIMSLVNAAQMLEGLDRFGISFQFKRIYLAALRELCIFTNLFLFIYLFIYLFYYYL